MIRFSYAHLVIGIVLLAVILLFMRVRKHDFWYLLFFSIFWLYLLFVVSVIVFPIVPLHGNDLEVFKPSINLVPFYFGGCYMPETCIRNVLGNILLTIPLGFGISFVARIKPRNILWLGILTGFIFEMTQLALSLMFHSAFRASDINDVILNAIGIWLGYGFFKIFGYLYLSITKRFEINHKYLLAYIYDVVRQSQG
jgi:glycopeptide antibiotics resistance protein